jgi:hypothetical protein
MPQSKKPRKTYKPRPVRVDAHGLAIDLASLLTHAQRAGFMNPAREALDSLRRGEGDWNAWRTMADVGNMAEALAEEGLAPNLIGNIERGQDVLGRIHGTVMDGGSWTLRGPEIVALDDLVWVHGVQLQHATQGEMARAIERVKARTRGALHGSVGKGTKVLVGALA